MLALYVFPFYYPFLSHLPIVKNNLVTTSLSLTHSLSLPLFLLLLLHLFLFLFLPPSPSSSLPPFLFLPPSLLSFFCVYLPISFPFSTLFSLMMSLPLSLILPLSILHPLGGCKGAPHAPISCSLIDRWNADRERLMSIDMAG